MQLVFALQNEIRMWLEGGRNRSLKGLAKKSGLGYSTIRRIESGEAQPQPHTAMKIVRVTRESAEQIHGWVLENIPEYSSHSEPSANLGVIYRAFDKSSATHAGVFRELNFGACRESDLATKFGPGTKQAVEDFVSAKIALKNESEVQLSESNVFVHNNENFVRELSKQNIDNFNPNLPGNVGFIEYLSTDDAGANAIYYLMMEFEERLEKLRREHSKGGDRKIGVSGMMTMFSEGKK